MNREDAIPGRLVRFRNPRVGVTGGMYGPMAEAGHDPTDIFRIETVGQSGSARLFNISQNRPAPNPFYSHRRVAVGRLTPLSGGPKG